MDLFGFLKKKEFAPYMFFASTAFTLIMLGVVVTNYVATFEGLSELRFGMWLGGLLTAGVQVYQFVYPYVTKDEVQLRLSDLIATILGGLWIVAIMIDYFTTLVYQFVALGGYSLSDNFNEGTWLSLLIYGLTSFVLVFSEIGVFVGIIGMQKSWRDWKREERKEVPTLRRATA